MPSHAPGERGDGSDDCLRIIEGGDLAVRLADLGGLRPLVDKRVQQTLLTARTTLRR